MLGCDFVRCSSLHREICEASTISISSARRHPGAPPASATLFANRTRSRFRRRKWECNVAAGDEGDDPQLFEKAVDEAEEILKRATELAGE